jgi:DNA adenine methylase
MRHLQIIMHYMKHKPFLKWAGNKYRIIDTLLPYLKPTNSGRIIDPFMGSGSLLMNHEADFYIGGDINPDLVLIFQFLKDDPEKFIESTRELFSPYWFDKNMNDRSKLKEERTGWAQKTYYELRSLFNEVKNPLTIDDKLARASLFVILNKYCFNGLCRYKANGDFTTPWNWAHKPAVFPETELRIAAERMKTAEVFHASFEDTIAVAEPGDLVYCDPPYLPLDNKPGTFTAYAKEGFSVEQHFLIASLAEHNRERQISTVISNHDCALASEIYSGADEIIKVQVHRAMNRYDGHANTAAEIVAVYRH